LAFISVKILQHKAKNTKLLIILCHFKIRKPPPPKNLRFSDLFGL